MGQRIFYGILVMVLLVLGVLLGQGVGFPTLEDGEVLTPDFVVELLGKIALPAVLIFATVRKVFETINSRVVEGKFEPGSLVDLLKSKEFILSMVSVLTGVIQIFAPTFVISEELQATIAATIMGIVTALLGSLAQRDSKDPIPTEVTAQAQLARTSGNVPVAVKQVPSKFPRS